MKYFLFTLIGVIMMLGVEAQEKVLTMEETILGYQLYPQNKNVAWQGEKNVLTYVEGVNLMAESVNSIEKECMPLIIPDYASIFNIL